MTDVTATPAESNGPEDEACDHPECIAFRAAAKEVDTRIRERASTNEFMVMLGVSPGGFLLTDVPADGPLIQIEYPGEGVDMAGEFARMQVEAPDLLAKLGATDLDSVPTIRFTTGINGYMANYGQAVALYEALGKALGKS